MTASALATSRCKPRRDWVARYLVQAHIKVDSCR